jgi:hypothetical protein
LAVVLARARAVALAVVVAMARAIAGGGEGGGEERCRSWLGNPFGIPLNSVINPIPDLLNSGIFIGISFFRS